MGQEVVLEAPATIVLTADYDRTRGQYPEHGDRYVHMEAGHVAENVHLVGESRGSGSCPVGAFVDDDVTDALDLPAPLEPLYLLPFGKPFIGPVIRAGWRATTPSVAAEAVKPLYGFVGVERRGGFHPE